MVDIRRSPNFALHNMLLSALIERDISFNTRVSAYFDEDNDQWLVTTQCGKRVRAPVGYGNRRFVCCQTPDRYRP